MRRRAAKEHPEVVGPFRTVVADPGWPYGDKLPGKSRGAAKNYRTMRVDQIARYLGSDEMMSDLEAATGLAHWENFLASDCRLFLWRVAPMQEEALHVMRAWGFGAPVSELAWAKTGDLDALNLKATRIARKFADRYSEGAAMIVHEARRLDFGMGRTFRMSHETCLVGRRGRPARLSASERSVLFAPVREHSRKPEEFFELVERLSPGPYLELFAGGHRREGWTCLGEDHRMRTDG